VDLYKVLEDDGRSPYTDHLWSLPTDGKSGAWMPVVTGKLEMCVNGYHLCREEDLIWWLGPVICTAELEADSEVLYGDNKVACRGPVRLPLKLETWNKTTARLFAADCAERVLPIFETHVPGDTRPREAIVAARAFARGEIDAAAWSAAWSAARRAAESVAERAAESVAWSAARSAAESAAWGAAWSAAWGAAGSAAGSAAWSAERQWQAGRLMQYLRGEIS
jgi:hypothetical protein